MEPIRVLVVDDSLLVRKMLTVLIDKEADMTVVGAARNGAECLDMVRQFAPDAITLDVLMPGMDGLETLTQLRRIDRAVPVIMFSSTTERGATATVTALTRGANDYVTKPARARNSLESFEAIHQQLIPKLRALSAARRTAPRSTSTLQGAYRPRTPVMASLRGLARPEVVAIGVSTGGPEALGRLIPALPADFPLPILVVQHMPASFTRVFAERLNAGAKLTVKEGAAGMVLRPGEVFLAPGDFHMYIEKASVSGNRIRLNQEPPVNSCRPSVDVLFDSVAEVFGEKSLAIVLTGMGTDGLRGAQALFHRSARIWAQDRDSCTVWGMPRAVSEAGLAEKILPIGDFAAEICKLLKIKCGS
jgi:two-component system, chemotaxis family, protein-glutamate methylesterase/glutaminase